MNLNSEFDHEVDKWSQNQKLGKAKAKIWNSVKTAKDGYPQMKPCRDESHEGTNPLPLSEFYKTPSGQFGRSAYCKVCHRKRAIVSVARYRERNLELGLRKHATVMERNDALNAAASRHKDGYLARHEEKRKREAEIAASLVEPIQEELVFVERKPMFSGFVRPQTRAFNWKVAWAYRF
jgi:hypothetical protein